MPHDLEDYEFSVTVQGRDTLDYLFRVTCEELRRLASTVKSADSSVTLNPSALLKTVQ